MTSEGTQKEHTRHTKIQGSLREEVDRASWLDRTERGEGRNATTPLEVYWGRSGGAAFGVGGENKKEAVWGNQPEKGVGGEGKNKQSNHYRGGKK